MFIRLSIVSQEGPEWNLMIRYCVCVLHRADDRAFSQNVRKRKDNRLFIILDIPLFIIWYAIYDRVVLYSWYACLEVHSYHLFPYIYLPLKIHSYLIDTAWGLCSLTPTFSHSVCNFISDRWFWDKLKVQCVRFRWKGSICRNWI